MGLQTVVQRQRFKNLAATVQTSAWNSGWIMFISNQFGISGASVDLFYAKQAVSRQKLWFFMSEGVTDDLFLVFPLCKVTKGAHFLHHPRCFEAVPLLKPAKRPSVMSYSHIFPSSSHLLISTEIIGGLFFFVQHNNWAVHFARETPTMLSSFRSRVERLVWITPLQTVNERAQRE